MSQKYVTMQIGDTMLPSSFGPVTSIAELPAETHMALVKLWNEFWSQVAVTDNPDDCWLWKGKIGASGYGVFKHAGVRGHAYAFAWMLTHPDTPTGNGLLLRHSCNNGPCCNPSHLSRGTYKENAQDRVAHGTQTRGSTHHNSKFTEEQVYSILQDHSDGVSAIVLAENHGVGYDTIWKVLNREQWTHVPLPPNWNGYKSSWDLKVTRTRRGATVSISKLTDEKVFQARLDFLNGSSATRLAKKYSLATKSMIYALREGWQHVPFPPGWDGYEAISKRNLKAYYDTLRRRK